MKTKMLPIILCLATTINAQYDIKSAYLKNPELTKVYIDSTARFWFDSYDSLFGGFYTDVNRDGSVNADHMIKTTMTQSRMAYAMVRAYMLTGDAMYLQYARGALNFMYEYAWDKTSGGWFAEFDREGNQVSTYSYWAHNYTKWSFIQQMALLGPGAMYEATTDQKDWMYLCDGSNMINSHLWDSRERYYGFYDFAGLDWTNPMNKTFAASAYGIAAHVMPMYLLTKEANHRSRLFELAGTFLDHIIPTMDEYAYGFAEKYNGYWRIIEPRTTVSTGNLLMAAHQLGGIFLIEQNMDYFNAATVLLHEVWDNAYDNTYGGVFADFDGRAGTMINQNKGYWQVVQAVKAGLLHFYISRDNNYLQMVDESLDFYMNFLVDHEYGEVYPFAAQNGDRTGDDYKGDYWKGGYHSIDLGYYTYLYATLFLHDQPISLYYNLVAAASERQLQLNPFAFLEDNLRIIKVLRNGAEYTDYSADSRKLHLPAGVDGQFQVTFELKVPSAIAVNADEMIAKSYRLYQNYPNPFNPSTQIQYRIAGDSHVRIHIFNMLGEEVKRLVDEYKSAGLYSTIWDGTDERGNMVPTGVYFYRMKADDFQDIKRMTLVK